MSLFTVFPAIDLREGYVVRLIQGDPNLATTYGNDPAGVANRWAAAGAKWLHVVNLDGAFGEVDRGNLMALRNILGTVPDVEVQFGGGIRTLQDIEQAFTLGVSRVILGTAAIESPELVRSAIKQFGSQRIGLGVDARDNLVRIRGWKEETVLTPSALIEQFQDTGLETVVFTNIARDGVGTGVDIAATQALAEKTGLAVIASGGVASLDDIRKVKRAQLSGVIVGRALYEGTIQLEEALTC